MSTFTDILEERLGPSATVLAVNRAVERLHPGHVRRYGTWMRDRVERVEKKARAREEAQERAREMSRRRG